MKKTDLTWSLFLDRDGVINKRLPDDYIKSWEEFEFLPGTVRALQVLRPLVKYIIVVTNQQGVAKGLMDIGALKNIHKNMRKVTRKHQAVIDQIYYCTDHSSMNPNCRKPNIDMGLQAKNDFQDLDLEYSIMIGDSDSDIQFGKNLKMKTVLISEQKGVKNQLVDFTCHDLLEFTRIFVRKFK